MGKIWVIRHAPTILNHVSDKLRPLYKGSTNMFINERFFDLDVSQQGINHANNLVKDFHSLDIQKVFVSPLRRALRTCDILFKNHPKKPEIIVNAALHERIYSLQDISIYEGVPLEEYKHFN